MSLINIAGLAPDNTGRAIRVNQFGNLLTATADFIPNGSVLLGSDQATALQADSVPLATADTANQRPGWYYENTAETNKINWYYYSDAADVNDRTYADLAGLTCTMAIDGQHPPYFAIYTKGTEHGWYGKKVVYQNQDADLNLFAGQKCLMYFAATAQDYPKNPDQLREINCPILAEDSDTPAPNDQILFITLQSDSNWPPGSFAGVVSQVGFKFVDNIVEYELKANLASGGVSADVNITNSYLATHATVYLGGNPVSAGTNAFPVILDGASTVQIEATNGDALTATAGALNIANTNIDKLTFDKSSNLNVFVAGGIPIYNVDTTPAIPSRIVDSQNVAFTNTVSGALDVCIRNTAAIDVAVADPVAITNDALTTMTFSTENNLQVQLANASGYVGAGNPLIIRPVASTITTNAWTIANFSGTGIGSVSEAIEASNCDSICVFGTSTHSGGGSDPSITYQYSLDNITYFDTPYAIALPNATPFENSRTLGVPWVRFKITTHALDSITLNICRK